MDELIAKVEELETRVQAIEQALSAVMEATKNENKQPKVYTDKELYALKEQLSWKKLEIRTGIKVSTLQYRVKKYKESIMFSDDT